jgi:hypothetical protein
LARFGLGYGQNVATSRGTAAVIRVLTSAALMLLLAGLVAGCGAPPTEDLARSVEQTRAAVRTVELALDQLGRDRTTAAVAQVAAANAADEIAQAQRQAGDVPGRSDADRALRGRALAAITGSLTVVLDAEDVLADEGDRRALAGELRRVDADLADTLAALGQR